MGILGFALHLHADIYGIGPTLFDRVVFGAPVFAPMLFPDLVMLAFIGLSVLYRKLPTAESTIDETIPSAQTNG